MKKSKAVICEIVFLVAAFGIYALVWFLPENASNLLFRSIIPALLINEYGTRFYRWIREDKQ